MRFYDELKMRHDLQTLLDACKAAKRFMETGSNPRIGDVGPARSEAAVYQVLTYAIAEVDS